MKKIGFIGTGIMGRSMAKNLMKAGYELSVYNRTKEKAKELIEAGALWCDSPAKCAAGQEAVITIVGYPKDVEEVYFGEQGVFAGADEGTILIDMTTTSPELAVRISEAAGKRGMLALDAPVTGGDTGAREGTLTILAGGDKEAFNRCLPLFGAMGKTIRYTGPAGNGQHTKMCNQIAIAGALSGACEALAYAKAVGLDPAVMLEAISTGAAGSAQLTNVASRILKDDYQPGFFIKHFIKDMTLADQEARDSGAKLGVLEYVLDMYKQLEEEGYGDLGTQALIKYYE